MTPNSFTRTGYTLFAPGQRSPHLIILSESRRFPGAPIQYDILCIRKALKIDRSVII